MRFVENAGGAHLRKLEQKVTDQTESFCPPLSLFAPVDIFVLLPFPALVSSLLKIRVLSWPARHSFDQCQKTTPAKSTKVET